MDGTAALQARDELIGTLDRHVGWEVDLNAARAIFTELVSNAMRHGKTPMEVRVECDGDFVRLQVSDSGRGFERLPAHPPLLGEGGRGLYIVSQYADRVQLGGNLRAAPL